MDHSTPNLPSRDFSRTEAFYGRLGFTSGWRDEGWMILTRGDLVLEFFRYDDLDPATSSFSCCLRLDDVMAFYDMCAASGLQTKHLGWPRLHKPRRESWGGTVGALIDEDGTLLRLIQN